MRFADYIVSFLSKKGLDTVFIVTGGGSMHLNNAFAASPDFNCYYFHHEQAAAIAAEGYARISGKPSVLNVTSGPGGLNAMTGVFGAYTDSLPIIVLSGQVKTDTLVQKSLNTNLRQLGDQEARIVQSVNHITKWSGQPQTLDQAKRMLVTMFDQATTGRHGPTWLDIPIDIQSKQVNDPIWFSDLDESIGTAELIHEEAFSIQQILKKLIVAKRPVILAGTGIRISNTITELQDIAEALQVPVCTAWAHDIFDNDHYLFAGRPGTIGTRAGNFVVQNADLILILGSRLNIRQVSYNLGSFAANAEKIWVDIDLAELEKPFPESDLQIQADLRTFMPLMRGAANSLSVKIDRASWVKWCRDINLKYTPKFTDYESSGTRINPYHFISDLFERLDRDDIVICGNASATIIPFQIGKLKFGQRLISNSGCASMGYDLPAAIGAAIADRRRRIICLAGDGSIMMNIQDLITVRNYNLNIWVFILENDGYLSIKQTQRTFFGFESGSSRDTGLMFPNFKDISRACSMDYQKLALNSYRNQLDAILKHAGTSGVVEVPCDLDQEFEPRLKSRQDGDKIITPDLDDMFPFLEREELNAIRGSCANI
ncbi:thiamine pyrophosphate-binding protein [Alphaproteobacteria bacterium]|nr:thiamine pyrophosphate-binding protein [Alphaproteobacteria bacterium]